MTNSMNKSQKVLKYIMNHKPKTRKAIQTYICERLNNKDYQEGYWCVQLGSLKDRGFFAKLNGRYEITNLGKAYIKDPKYANLKSKYLRAIEQRDNALDSVGDWETMPHSLRQENERLKKEVERQNIAYDQLHESNHELLAKLERAENAFHSIKEDYGKKLVELDQKSKKLILATMNVDELEEERDSEYKKLSDCYAQLSLEKIELETKLQKDTSGDFTNAQLINIIKAMVS